VRTSASGSLAIFSHIHVYSYVGLWRKLLPFKLLVGVYYLWREHLSEGGQLDCSGGAHFGLRVPQQPHVGRSHLVKRQVVPCRKKGEFYDMRDIQTRRRGDS